VARAPWPVGLVFGISLAVVITLLGPLLLFNPWFTTVLQERHAVADAFGVSQTAVTEATSEMLWDIVTDGPFDSAFPGEPPLLDEAERSHMSDVSRLVQILAATTILALVLAGVTAAWLRREPRRQGRIMLVAAGAIGLVAVVLAAAFALAFDQAFSAFHQVFFPPGTWQFAPGSNLITLFPEGFWFDAALAAGTAILLTALVVSLIGAWHWRTAPGTPAKA
jgi:integral membrane protein (TIGR01906 family)